MLNIRFSHTVAKCHVVHLFEYQSNVRTGTPLITLWLRYTMPVLGVIKGGIITRDEMSMAVKIYSRCIVFVFRYF